MKPQKRLLVALILMLIYFSSNLGWAQGYERVVSTTSSYENGIGVAHGQTLTTGVMPIVGMSAPNFFERNALIVAPVECGVKTRVFGTANESEYFYAGCYQPDHLAAVGVVHPHSLSLINNNSDLLFSMFTPDGSVLTSSIRIDIGGPQDDERAFKMIEPIPLTYLIVGATDARANVLGNYDAFVMSVTATNVSPNVYTSTVNWCTLLGDIGASDQAKDVAYDHQSGEVIVIGSTGTFGLGTGTIDAFVAKLDFNTGTVIAAQAYGTGSNLAPTSLEIDPANDVFYMAGNDHAGHLGGIDGFLLTANLSSLGMTDYQVFGGNQGDLVTDMAYSEISGIKQVYLSGYTWSTNGNATDGSFISFDCSNPTAPVMSASVEIGGTGREELFSIDEVADLNGFMMSGRTTSIALQGSLEVYYVAVDPFGSIGNCQTGSSYSFTNQPITDQPVSPVTFSPPLNVTQHPMQTISVSTQSAQICGPNCKAGDSTNNDDLEKVQDNTIDIFPNPSSGLVELHFSGEWKGGIRIVDMYGKVYREIEEGRNVERIDLADVAAGIYFVSRTAKDGTVKVKKMIVK